MKFRRLSFFLLLLTVNFSYAAQASSAQHGMVVSEDIIASKIGADILKAGGNAIDAAVAVGYALAVVNPCCGNIGGGGFMLIHRADGANIFLNFREKAPEKATANLFLDEHGKPLRNKSTHGYLAVAVPGSVLGFDTVLQKYGTMNRREIMAPAIQLAQQGYIVSDYQAKLFAKYATEFKTQPNVAAIFLKNGEPYQAGERLVQTDLANTLKLIAFLGAEVFYHGLIAQAIVRSSEANGGILTMKDFANYSVQELAPIQCSYRHYEIISAPPPSSGGVTLCEILNILENFSLRTSSYDSPKNAAFIIEAMRYGFSDRNKLGDPDFVKNPMDTLLSKTYAKEISEKIRHTYFAPIIENVDEKSQMHTTHYSVIDKQGNAVAVTYTLNGWFGAKVIADETGFFLNNEMDDFSAEANVPNQFGLLQSAVNRIEPGKRPLSSMTPTMIFRDGELFLVTGSPGGPRIITSVLQTILNVIDYNMPIQLAVNMPRFHYQIHPDLVYTEPFAFSFFTQSLLQMRGYHFQTESPWSAVEAILIDQQGLHAGSDNRRPDGGPAES